MPQFLLHHALAFNPQSRHAASVSSAIHWDIRLPPSSARLSGSPSYPHTGLPPHVLAQPATAPPVPIFRIASGVLPAAWTVEVRNARGVTVGDVLGALWEGGRKRVRGGEWRGVMRAHQGKVGEAWYGRCREAGERVGRREGRRRGEEERAREEEAGVRRVDWFVRSTCFVGLTPSVERAYTWTLTTKRAGK